MLARTALKLCLAGLLVLIASAAFASSASAAGVLAFEPEEVAFGAVPAGEQRSLPLSLSNIGPDPVVLGDAWLVYDEGATVEPFSVDPGSCATVFVLAAGAECEMTATFLAAQQNGSFEALAVAEGEGVDPAVAVLSGQSVPPPPTGKLVAEPTRISFPRTRIDSVSAPRLVRVRNAGDNTIAVPPAAVTNPHFEVVSNDCPQLLAAGAECTVAVVFKPTDGLPLPIGYLVGEDRHAGALAFGPRDLATNRFQLAVSLSGGVAPRLPPPDPEALIKSGLARLSDSVPAALRGGPRHGRLAVFQAPLAGWLALRVYGWQGKRRVLVATGRARLAKGERRRLRISLTRSGRELLLRPKRTRVKAVLSFTVAADRTLLTRTRALTVKPPKARRTKP